MIAVQIRSNSLRIACQHDEPRTALVLVNGSRVPLRPGRDGLDVPATENLSGDFIDPPYRVLRSRSSVNNVASAALLVRPSALTSRVNPVKVMVERTGPEGLRPAAVAARTGAEPDVNPGSKGSGGLDMAPTQESNCLRLSTQPTTSSAT